MKTYRSTMAEIEAEHQKRVAERAARNPAPPPKPKLTMAEGRRAKALDGNLVHNGEVVSRRQLVDRMVREGATVQTAPSGERRLQHQDGRYLSEKQIGKVAMDYAAEKVSPAAPKVLGSRDVPKLSSGSSVDDEPRDDHGRWTK